VTEPFSQPWSTYRVQLHHEFTFCDLAAIADYLAELGVTHAYCSPSLQAVAGSTHGYDVVDPHRLNRELGGPAGYAEMVDALQRNGLGQVLDIVPNHMAIDPRDNRWWWDVLANGRSSPHARYFDIDWDSPERKLTGSVLVPILGDHYGRVLEAGELMVARNEGSFVVRYFDHVLPLSPRSVDDLLARAASQVSSADLAVLAAGLGSLPHALIVEPDVAAERHRRSRLLQDRLAHLVATQPAVAAAIDAEVDAVNADYDVLDALLQRQNYRLALWRTASEELDYRRFFNIETLVGLRVEDEEVFEDTHSVIVALVVGGLIDGLRIDHVDGLLDPAGYLERLQDATGAIWVVVEKILAPDEELPEDWPVAGTTGYEFLNRVNGLFVAGDNLAELTSFYRHFSGVTGEYADLVREAKFQIMREELAAEVDRLTDLLATVAERHRRYRDYTRRELRDGLREVLAAFPVYRTYVRPGHPVREFDRQVIDRSVCEAQARRGDVDPELFNFLGAVLRLEYPGAREEEFAARFQQFSGPVMAKGVEDTVFYRYNRLVSLNEVGGSPDLVDGAVDRFHGHNFRAVARWPATQLTLATHDTKRGPDTRARINVLSEIPGPWRAAVTAWAERNARYWGEQEPDRNAEYLLYQTLVGAWPIETDRVVAYMEKATKEAKVNTSWVSPNPEYDEALSAFVTRILADQGFVAALEEFLAVNRVVHAGRVNSLAQMALLLSSPGVPDIYQGTELWDHSLVDPDNRRPVDYELRRKLLAAMACVEMVGEAGVDTGPPAVGDDGAAKLWLTHRVLADRRARPDAYGPASEYNSLTVDGPDRNHVVAFSRRGGLVTVVPRLGQALASAQREPDARLVLPPGSWTDVLSGARFDGAVSVAELWAAFPVAVLAGPADAPMPAVLEGPADMEEPAVLEEPAIPAAPAAPAMSDARAL
jgi:(1->4)-alpha-D-glucan 1-alpha-D-glucosylmutase